MLGCWVFVLTYFSLVNRNTSLMEVLKHISFTDFSYDNKEERWQSIMREAGEGGRQGPPGLRCNYYSHTALNSHLRETKTLALCSSHWDCSSSLSDISKHLLSLSGDCWPGWSEGGLCSSTIEQDRAHTLLISFIVSNSPVTPFSRLTQWCVL